VTRQSDLDRFYSLLAQLETKIGGYRYLRTCKGSTGWPERGIYFFFEEGEIRAHQKIRRVVRVGTHAVSTGSKTTLWNRLSQHRGNLVGQYPAGGNHRGSIFRLHLGRALLKKGKYPTKIKKSWGEGDSGNRAVRELESQLEKDVSTVIGAMPFLWVAVNDKSDKQSDRKIIERNSIGLLSNYNQRAIDPPSNKWLGHYAADAAICKSGLWNVHHVDEGYDPSFLSVLERYIRQLG
jgi:hypothetical protein